MTMYEADDVAVALSTLFENVIAPLIANHQSAEAICDRLEEAAEAAEGHDDPAVSLSRRIVVHMLAAARREIDQQG